MTKIDGGGHQNGPSFGFVQVGLNFVVNGPNCKTRGSGCQELACWKRAQSDIDGGLQDDCFENINDGDWTANRERIDPLDTFRLDGEERLVMKYRCGRRVRWRFAECCCGLWRERQCPNTRDHPRQMARAW